MKGKKKGVAKEKLKALAQKLVLVKEEDIPIQAPSTPEIHNLLHQYQTGQYGYAETLAVSITNDFPTINLAGKCLAQCYIQTGRDS